MNLTKAMNLLRAGVIQLSIALLLSACHREPAVQTPKLLEWRTWQLPPEGPSLPTPRSLSVGLKDELVVLDTAGRVTIYDSNGTLLRQWHMLDVSVGKPEGVTILSNTIAFNGDAGIGQRNAAAGAVFDLFAALLLDTVLHEILEGQRQRTRQRNADGDRSEFSLYRRHAQTLQPRAKFAHLALSAA